MINPVKYDLGGYRKFGIISDKKYHLGHDYKVEIGINVIAIAEGIIKDIREANGFGGWNPSKKGWYIWIQHGNICALYGHVKPLNIKIGDPVREGQIIGNVHDYIRNNFHLPHLHLGIWDGINYPSNNLGYDKSLKQWINPKKFIQEGIF